MELKRKLESWLFYGGIEKDRFEHVQTAVRESNLRALKHWSVLVSLFWLYCLLMSLKAADYALCRPAYAVALGCCVLTWLSTRFLIPRVPQALGPCMFFFRLSLLGGGIGIAMCQWNVRSLTMFAVAIVSPSIFVDSTAMSVVVHFVAVLLYMMLGRSVIEPDVYAWGLGNLVLFSVFGILIGNAINKERFERYVFADSATKLADMRHKFAYYDQMTGLKNRRAYSERLERLSKALTRPCCVVMIDVNGLKQMNDSRGHAAGDELILGTAECIRAAFPEAEDAYRLGGDEFCVLLTENASSAQVGVTVLERIARDWKGELVQGVSLACGLASDADAENIEEITKIADQRMYEAKREHYASRGFDRRRR